MADYDVQAIALATPANPSPLDTYRPAITVRNNGRYSAVATGYVQAYKAGLQVFASPVTSPAIAPGETGLATAADDWTPDTEDDYVFFGYVTTNLDQVEPNNNLQPSTVRISGQPPPPPIIVPAHRTQHQAGGSDELELSGLPGTLADPQTPTDHAAAHQVGGDDAINLGGLSGQAAEPQTPDVHGNEAHSPDMATASALASHQNGAIVHASATNLAHRDLSGVLAGLVPDSELTTGSEFAGAGQDADREALLRATPGHPATGRLYGFPWPTDHAPMHAPGGRDPITMPAVLNTAAGPVLFSNVSPKTLLVQKSFLAIHSIPGLSLLIRSTGLLHITAGAGQGCTIELDYVHGVTTTNLLTQVIPITANHDYTLEIRTLSGIDPLGNWQSCGVIVLNDIAAATGDQHLVPFQVGVIPSVVADGSLKLNFTPTGWAAASGGTFPASLVQGSVQL